MSKNSMSVRSRMMRSHISIADMCKRIEVKTGMPSSYRDVQRAYNGEVTQYAEVIEQILSDVEESEVVNDG